MGRKKSNARVLSRRKRVISPKQPKGSWLVKLEETETRGG